MKATDFFKGNYIKAAELVGKTITFTISQVVAGEFTTDGGGTETKPVLEFQDHEQSLVLNKTNLNNLADLFGNDLDKWAGKQVTLHGDKTPFKGKMVETIRVSAVRKAA
jgi:hypothetical protein